MAIKLADAHNDTIILPTEMECTSVERAFEIWVRSIEK
jgi:hypothetical protein